MNSMKYEFKQNELDEMRKNPNNYKWGIFYFNSKDPRFFVPKRNIAMGWTLNFANTYSYLIVFLIIVIILVSLVSKFSVQTKSEPQAKIDPRVACESALAYTTFSSGEEADAFVKDCIDGKYPEVIERYKAQLNLGEGAQI